jgi:hypothetical protein
VKVREKYPTARRFYTAHVDVGAPQWDELTDRLQGNWIARWTDELENEVTEPEAPACGECGHADGDHYAGCHELVRKQFEDKHEPFAGGGVREAVGDRARFELLLPLGVPYSEQLLTRCAVHMAKGAQKYASRNWEAFSDEDALERCQSSALRHIHQWMTGVDDGEDHAAAVVFNLMAAEHVKAKLEGRY